MRFPLLITSLLLSASVAHAATISVTTTADTIADDGKTSLREALQIANNTSTPTTIAFQIPTSDSGYDGSVWTIRPTTALPSLTAPGITIDGYTQPGARANTQAIGSDAVWKIQLQGPQAGGNVDGLTLSGGNAVVRGLMINRFISSDTFGRTAIFVHSANNVIEGCFVSALSASTGDNVAIRVLGANANNNLIGGTTPQARNVLSNSGAGLVISRSASGNLVQGNYIGTDASGLRAATNTHGIIMGTPGTNNLIGGASIGARNVIAGNKRGIELLFGSGNRVQGNFIGTDATGTRALGNTEYGVQFVDRADDSGNNLLGGAGAGEGNVICGNGVGVRLEGFQDRVYGNLIGVLPSGAPLGNTGAGVLLDSCEEVVVGGVEAGQGNRIAFNGGGIVVTAAFAFEGGSLRGNSIFANQGLGIDRAEKGVTPNQTGTTPFYLDSSANFPILQSATISAGQITVSGTLNSRRPISFELTPTFALDFYLNDVADESGYGEGKTYIGSTSVVTDAQGNASFTFRARGSFGGRFVTATSSSLKYAVTSEFSRALAVQDQASPRISIKRPADTGIYSNVPTANGLLMDDGAGVQSVKVLLYRFAASGVEAGYWNGSEWTPKLTRANYLPAIIAGTTWSFRMPTSAQGFVETRYGLRAYAFDAAGNSGLSRVSRFLIDRTAPSVRITTPQSGTSYAGLTQAQGTTADEGGAGVARVTIVLYRYPSSTAPRAFFNGRAFVAQQSPLIYRLATLQEDGTWTFALPSQEQGFTPGRYALRADVVDRAGNIGRPYHTDFVLGDMAPS